MKLFRDHSTFIYSTLFIVLYGSGFVGAKLGFPYASPLVFLVIRFSISMLLLMLIALCVRAPWPSSWREAGHIAVSGLFLVCLFSIGTWESMDMGVAPATSALIIALQPLSVAILGFFVLDKPVSVSQWIGLVLGLMGVVLVVGEKASLNSQYLLGVMMSFLGLAGLTVGNLYQKQFCSGMNIFTGGVIQSLASGLVCLLCMFCFSRFEVQWTGQFIFSLFWMCVIVSLGAISFLYILLSRGESHKVASLFYLVPIVTAIISYLVFNQSLDTLQVIGMLLAALGVSFVNFNFTGMSKDMASVSNK